MEETVLEKEEQKIENLPEVEVVEIYPDPEKPKSGVKERGTCHISIKEMGIDIKNIMYIINNAGVIRILGPTKVYREPIAPESKTKPKAILVPTILFHNKALWEHIQNVIREEIKGLSDR